MVVFSVDLNQARSEAVAHCGRCFGEQRMVFGGQDLSPVLGHKDQVNMKSKYAGPATSVVHETKWYSCAVAHRYRLYPTTEEADRLRFHCDQRRAVWNMAVEQDRFALRYRPYRIGKRQNWPGRSFDLAEARQVSDWLRSGSSSIQQQALRDYRQAMSNHHGNRQHFRRPDFKSKNDAQGFTIRDVSVRKLSRKWSTVDAPKLGPVRFRTSRPLPDDYGMAKVTLDRSGRWHVSFVAPQPAVERESTGRVVGVDLGVTNSVTLSDGRRFHCPQPGQGEQQRRLRLERQLARQRKGSNRRNQTKIALAKIRRRDADRRKDWAERLSTRLVREFDLIVFEDVRAADLTRSAKGTVEIPGVNVRAKAGLNRSILAAGWAVRDRTEAKAEASVDCHTVRVSAVNTSRRCSACGHIVEGSRESQARFICRGCGHESNADVNAANVILAAGQSGFDRYAVTGRGVFGTGRDDEAPTGEGLAA